MLSLTSFAAKISPVGRFENFHSKLLSSTPLKLDDASYEDLTRAPRDYSAVVLLTALEARFGCQMCRDFQPEWEVIAKSWTRGDRQGSNRVVYGTLDFTDGKGTFQKVCAAIYISIFLGNIVYLSNVSSCFKLRLFYYFFRQPPASMPNQTDSQFDMISLPGKL